MQVLSSYEEKVVPQIRRRLVKSFMDVLILSSLKEKPMSGYDIISLIYKKFGILPGSGSIYSLLYSIERKGLVKGIWEERRRVYVLTSKGEDVIKATIKSYESIEKFVMALLSK